MSKLLDYLSLPIALWLATFFRFHLPWFEVREYYLLISSVVAWMAASSLLRIYSGEERADALSRRIAVVITFFFIMTGLSFYAHNELDFSRIVLVLFSLFQFTLPPLLRSVLTRLFASHRHPSRYHSLLIGSGPLFESLCAEYTNRKKNFAVLNIESCAVHEIIEKVRESVRINSSAECICIPSAISHELNDAIIAITRELGIRCQILTDNTLIASSPLKAETIGNRTHFRPLVNRLELQDNRIAKRIFDIFLSLLLILLISPVLAVTALFIKISSPREPILFRQKRTGYNQKIFHCNKFRSMATNSDADTKQATVGDRRITKLGSLLRKTSIDELPQLFNVLKGDMSLVGPRPHPVVMNELQEQVPEYLLRHFVLPGITGWAQVNGWRGPTDTDERIQKRIECDLWYVENWSIWLDLKILFLTLFSRKTWDGAF